MNLEQMNHKTIYTIIYIFIIIDIFQIIFAIHNFPEARKLFC